MYGILFILQLPPHREILLSFPVLHQVRQAAFLFFRSTEVDTDTGGVCYYVEKEGVLFSGDTLFCCSVGRSDFATSSTSALIRSIKEKLFLLPDETKVFPGHMGATTIGNEKVNNPYV